MANEEHLAILRQGVEAWNQWRGENPYVEVDLTGADLRGADLSYADLSGVNLSRADLRGANLSDADLTYVYVPIKHVVYVANLSYADLRDANFRKAELDMASLVGANLEGAYLRYAILVQADLTEANLRYADLTEADLLSADLTKADLTGATLMGTTLVEAIVEKAKISESSVYSVSVWGLEGEFEEQRDLIITDPFNDEEPEITVDNIKVAQFIYLILRNHEIREVINTLTSKSVLILGRFSIAERKSVLDALRNKLREYNLLPIVFDFDRPQDKDFTETIKTLAGISYFVIADITNPKSSPLELQATVPDYQIPFVPILQEGEQPFAMMVDLQKKYNWVLPTKTYDSVDTLMQALKPGIIDPAVQMHNKLRLDKAQKQESESLKDYLDKSL